MKSLRLISIFMIATVLFTGCDFFRKIAGKPTSKELERMEREEAARLKKQYELDSVKKAQELLEQEMAEKAANNILDENAKRFQVILGSFKVKENAEKMKSLLESKGYAPKIILFQNGFSVVSAASFDTRREAFNEVGKFLEFEFCPYDVWVYDITQNLHAI